jgi:hypothetical protein
LILQEPIGPHPKPELFNVIDERDGIFKGSSDDDKFEITFPSEFGSRMNMIGQAPTLSKQWSNSTQ